MDERFIRILAAVGIDYTATTDADGVTQHVYTPRESIRTTADAIRDVQRTLDDEAAQERSSRLLGPYG